MLMTYYYNYGNHFLDYVYSGPSDIRTLQYPDNFSWEQIILTLFCLIYLEFRVPDPDGQFLLQNALLRYILVPLSGQ